jgi:hypothetical protein
LTVGGILETIAGLVVLIAPAQFASLPLRTPLDPAGVVIGRIAGGALLSLGIACWCARTTPSAPASIGVCRALFVYNVVACVALALASPPLASGGLLATSAAVLHGALAVALAWTLLGREN